MASVDLSRGNFKQLVTIKTVAKTKNDSAGHEEEYTTLVSNTPAVVISKGGSRMMSEGTDYVVERKDVYVTWRSAFNAIDKDSRVNYNGKDYSIQAKNFVEEVKHILKLEVVGI